MHLSLLRGQIDSLTVLAGVVLYNGIFTISRNGTSRTSDLKILANSLPIKVQQ